MSEERNPYAAPQARTVAAAAVPAEPGIDVLRAEPLRLPAGAGGDWLAEGWQLFRKNSLILALIGLLYIVVAMASGMVPLIGNLFMQLTFGIWSAGFYLIGQKLRRDEIVTVADLFAGFSHPQAGRLFMIGLVYLGGFLLVMLATGLLAVLLFGLNFLQAFMNGDGIAGLGALPWISLLLLLTVFLVGMFLLLAAMLFAAPLVIFHGMEVLAACSLSLKAVLRNWPAMTVYGLIVIGLAIASIVTLFLAWIVLIPLLALAGYVSYRQIFLEDAPR